jgi:isocitrate/isopropylmalate dehydrogenase
VPSVIAGREQAMTWPVHGAAADLARQSVAHPAARIHDDA